jgi:Fe-S-cluster formation regulator IscX/YfhJ
LTLQRMKWGDSRGLCTYDKDEVFMRIEPKTVEFKDMWLAPVANESFLPTNAEDGQLCFAQEDDEAFLRVDGSWRRMSDIALAKGDVPAPPPRY